MSWEEEGRTESHLVSLWKLDEEGAAVMTETVPPGDRSVLLHVDLGPSRVASVPARVDSQAAGGFGRALVSLKFAPAVFPMDLVSGRRERRAWRRQRPREKAAVLSWVSKNSTVTARVELRDIGGGGAAVVSQERPLGEASLWLWVGREGNEAGPVECRLVGLEAAAGDMHVVRLAFVGLCPIHVFEVAMGLRGAGAGQDC
ncbi:hypothetical protein [Aquisphaera giovannonii]|uniref:hypothetical protein n=1 Tax=Aquisphaera giovannonii TaxID=406548 RepID=UPI0011DF932D|nr:hypothetical protein [Aquisphaera giovannonii]